MASLHIQPHCASARRNRCKEHFNSFFTGELEETTRTPHTTWMKTIQQDLESFNLSLNEAITWLRIAHSGD